MNKFNEKLGMTQLEKVFKLVGTINLNNIAAFNDESKIKKYASINDMSIG